MDGCTEVVCCQDVISHTGGIMPATVMFGSRSIPKVYARNNIFLSERERTAVLLRLRSGRHMHISPA